MSNDHEWLKLIEVSGPFLEVPVLREVFPQGLDALASGRPQRLRRTYEEWRDAVDVVDVDLSALHAAWIDEVLLTALEIDSAVLRRGKDIPDRLTLAMPEHGVSINPDMAVVNPTNDDAALLLIHIYEPDTDLDATRRFEGLAITPADRMVSLLRATGCPIGLVTNGERWQLVHAPVGAVAGFASWYARYWGPEPETLRAFVSLLGVRRFFGPDEGKLPSLYERSLKHQDDVTEALGEQVRRAVEVLVQALDRADQDRNRELLRDVDPRALYEAGLTVMMRLVFLLAAEERGLLLLGDPRYDAFYAISSLRMQLRADSEEILERRRSAWSRLLALFRGVYGGIDHPTLRLPALGGSLFDPDRYPFLEGRKKGTSWRSDPAEPLPIDDRTVLLLLEAIQTFHGRTLSYRALDVEQIGHVYEGLLDRTVKRVDDVTLELDCGAKAKSPRVTLGELESARLDSMTIVGELLKERSERSDTAIRNALDRVTDDRLAARLLTVCRGDIGLRDRILPYALLLRTDPWGYPLVHHSGAFVVASGTDRRDSGAHYTPKVLTEKIVGETLTPIVYRGPAQGRAEEQWELKSASELLDLKICDPAMGSGAFLVQVCRWLSARLVEAWSATEAAGKKIDSEGRVFAEDDADGFEPLSQVLEERAMLARRLIAERCLYGVDVNPLAVELAKLSLWLTTMSKGRPFGFLDHNLRSGDSLFGIHDIGQLTELSMVPNGSKQLRLFGRSIQVAVEKAVKLRKRLRSIPIRDIGDVDAMAALDAESRQALLLPQSVADAFVGIVLSEAHAAERADRLQALEALADAAAHGTESAIDRMRGDALTDLRIESPDGLPRTPFHWPLEFPEVFGEEQDGFDAFLGNPPFLGGHKITGAFGTCYRDYLVENVSGGQKGRADFVVYFFLRAHDLLNRLGYFGLIGVNTISEGDSRKVGLEALIRERNAIIVAAFPDQKWPGAAAVVTSSVILAKGSWGGTRRLGSNVVETISPFLTSEESWSPKRLKNNVGISFEGSKPTGMGFVLSAEEASELVNNDKSASEVVFPYLIARDLNSSPDLLAKRSIISFWDWPLNRASQYQAAFTIVEDRVRPERQRLKPNGQYQLRKPLPQKWWQFGEKRPALYHAIGRDGHFVDHPTGWTGQEEPMDRVLVIARVSKTGAFAFVPNDQIFSDSLVVFALNQYQQFAILQSSIHLAWAWQQCSQMKSDMRYTHNDILETFPFPEAPDVNQLCELGKQYHELRSRIMSTRAIGLTALYSIFNQPNEVSDEILELRWLHKKIDEIVRDQFCWSDISLDHSFHEVAYLPENERIRFTISESARLEVLRRLAELNRLRYQEEVDQGLHGGTAGLAKAGGRRSRAASASEPTLDFDDIIPTTSEGDD